MLRELLRLMRKRVVVVANKSKKVPAGSLITHDNNDCTGTLKSVD